MTDGVHLRRWVIDANGETTCAVMWYLLNDLSEAGDHQRTATRGS